MAAIPAALIAPLQAALQQQGFPVETIRPDGTLNPAGLLAGVYSEVEFRSATTPNIRLNTNALLSDGPPNPFMAWLKPTVILRGAGGETAIAPLGAHPGGSILPLVGVAAALVAAGYALRAFTER